MQDGLRLGMTYPLKMQDRKNRLEICTPRFLSGDLFEKRGLVELHGTISSVHSDQKANYVYHRR